MTTTTTGSDICFAYVRLGVFGECDCNRCERAAEDAAGAEAEESTDEESGS